MSPRRLALILAVLVAATLATLAWLTHTIKEL